MLGLFGVIFSRLATIKTYSIQRPGPLAYGVHINGVGSLYREGYVPTRQDPDSVLLMCVEYVPELLVMVL